MKKQNKRPQQRRLKGPAPPRNAIPQKRRLRFLTSPLAIFLEVLGAAASGIAMWEVYWGTTPEIHSLGPNNNPFSLPFAVKNPSHILDMRDAQFVCGIQKIKGQNFDIGDFSIIAEQPKTIAAGEVRNSLCSIEVAGYDFSAPSFSARISVRAKYKTLLFDRESPSTLFIWEPLARPPRWIEGEVTRIGG